MICHESNTFVDQPIILESFRNDTLMTGPAIRDQFGKSHHEMGGFFAGLEEVGIEPVPLLAARIIPGSVITAETYDQLSSLLFGELESAGDLDGLLVAPHGASVCETALDMDGDWLARLRTQVGSRVPIISTLDAHASLSQKMVDATDAIVAYRTYSAPGPVRSRLESSRSHGTPPSVVKSDRDNRPAIHPW